MIFDVLVASPYSFSYEEIGRQTPRQTLRLFFRAVSTVAADDQGGAPHDGELREARRPAGSEPQPPGDPPKKRHTRYFQNVRGLQFEKYECFRFTPQEQSLWDRGIDPETVKDDAALGISEDLARERFYTMSALFNRKQGNPPVPQLGLKGVEKGDLDGCRDWCDQVWAATLHKRRTQESRNVQGEQHQ